MELDCASFLFRSNFKLFCCNSDVMWNAMGVDLSRKEACPWCHSSKCSFGVCLVSLQGLWKVCFLCEVDISLRWSYLWFDNELRGNLHDVVRNFKAFPTQLLLMLPWNFLSIPSTSHEKTPLGGMCPITYGGLVDELNWKHQQAYNVLMSLSTFQGLVLKEW